MRIGELAKKQAYRQMQFVFTKSRDLLKGRLAARECGRSAKSCRATNEVIEEQLVSLRERIRELKKLEKNLTRLRSVCNEELSPRNCLIIRNLQKH